MIDEAVKVQEPKVEPLGPGERVPNVEKKAEASIKAGAGEAWKRP